MPYGITQCYLPPDRSDVPAFTPAEAGAFSLRYLSSLHTMRQAILTCQSNLRGRPFERQYPDRHVSKGLWSRTTALYDYTVLSKNRNDDERQLLMWSTAIRRNVDNTSVVWPCLNERVRRSVLRSFRRCK